MPSNSQPYPLPPDGAHAHVAGLEHVSGRLQVDVAGDPVGTLDIRDGDVKFQRATAAPGDATVNCDSGDTLAALTAGTLNPVVAALQNRIDITGNRWFGIRAALGLLGAKPFQAQSRAP